MFILELTLRSWNHSEENKRRTLQRNDIAAAITRTDIFDFLVSHCDSVIRTGIPSIVACIYCLAAIELSLETHAAQNASSWVTLQRNVASDTMLI